MDISELNNLGNPDLEIAGLRLWIHGREFPHANDFWDGNWIRVTAYYIQVDSIIQVHGPIIHLRELYGLQRECENLYKNLQGTAGLQCLEPNLGVKLTAKTGGQIEVSITITPDHLRETHSFIDNIDQTYLPPLISSCINILLKYPVYQPENLSA